MTGLDMLDVAIGVIFVFLLLSMIASALTEIIEAFMKQRAYELEKGIKRMLLGRVTAQTAAGANEAATNEAATNEAATNEAGANEAGAEKPDLVTELYNHQLISALYDGTYYDAKKVISRVWPKLPSYIPSRSFALALLDLLGPEADDKGNKNLSMAALKESIASKATATVKEALLPLIDAAEREADGAQVKLESVLKGIEQWYDSAMDRVTSFYKRRVQYFTLAIGLAVAILLNADTLAITNSLIHDPALRSALVSTAQEYAKDPPTPTSSPSAIPSATPTTPKPTVAPGATSPSEPKPALPEGKTAKSPDPAAVSAVNAANANSAANGSSNITNAPPPNKNTGANAANANTASNQSNNNAADNPADPCKDAQSAECKKFKECKEDPKGTGCKKVLCDVDSHTSECKTATVCDGKPEAPECKLAVTLAEVKSLGLPIGWDSIHDPFSKDFPWWLLKLFGWIITAIAISLGAPFWFDLLNKFMMVRSTLKPGEKTNSDKS